MCKLLIERIGFIFEVNGFFWSGFFYCQEMFITSIILLFFSIWLAFYVGTLIYTRGSNSITPTP